MRRISTATKSADLFGEGKDGFTDGNPSLGVPATQLNAPWFNAVQEEIAKVIEATGAALNGEDLTQLYNAIQWMIDQQSTGRTRLTQDITLYVSTTGSDSNDGLTVGTPFLTIQKACNILAKTYDLAGFNATIQLANGTYATGATVPVLVGSGNLIIQGNLTTPTSVIVPNITMSPCSVVTLKGMKLSGSTSCIMTTANSSVNVDKVVYGTASVTHIYLANNSNYGVASGASSLIDGSAPIHIFCRQSSTAYLVGSTMTVSNTPAFSTAFCVVDHSANIMCGSMTITGSATGTRYALSTNGVLDTAGGGASYLPGSVAGTTATGGQYV